MDEAYLKEVYSFQQDEISPSGRTSGCDKYISILTAEARFKSSSKFINVIDG
jgi:hypothetical protein